MQSKKANSTLTAQLADATKTQRTLNQNQSQELADAKTRIQDLLAQISDLRGDKERMRNDFISLKGKLEESLVQVEKANGKIEVYFKTI